LQNADAHALCERFGFRPAHPEWTLTRARPGVVASGSTAQAAGSEDDPEVSQ